MEEEVEGAAGAEFQDEVQPAVMVAQAPQRHYVVVRACSNIKVFYLVIYAFCCLSASGQFARSYAAQGPNLNTRPMTPILKAYSNPRSIERVKSSTFNANDR